MVLIFDVHALPYEEHRHNLPTGHGNPVGRPPVSLVQINDIVVRSMTWEKHLQHLEVGFSPWRNVWLKVKMKKRQIRLQKTENLGLIGSGTGLRADLNKRSAVESLSVLSTKKEPSSLLA